MKWRLMKITTFRNAFEAYTRPDQIYDLDWNSIVNLLFEVNQQKVKEQVPMFNLWEFKTEDYEPGRIYEHIIEDGKKRRTEEFDYIPNTIRRCAANVIGLHGLVIDYDGRKTISETIKNYIDFEFVIYTTFNHSKDKEKFRLVLPFTRLMPLNEFLLKQTDMQECFEGADNASFSISQAIHLHSIGPSGQSFVYHNSGYDLDPDWFKESPTPQVVDQTWAYDGEMSPQSQQVFKQNVMASLGTCSGIRRGAQKKNGGGLTLAVIVKSIGGSFTEFQMLCHMITASDSCLRTIEIQQETWNSVSTEHITRTERENFIKANNGVIKRVASTWNSDQIWRGKVETLRMKELLQQTLKVKKYDNIDNIETGNSKVEK